VFCSFIIRVGRVQKRGVKFQNCFKIVQSHRTDAALDIL